MVRDEVLRDLPPCPIVPQKTRVFTTPEDIRLLIWLSHQAPPGDIVEVGCNEGYTTQHLALYNLSRIVWGYDPGVSTNPEQANEEPPEVGHLCKPLANVRVVKAPVQQHKTKFAFAFIDGDHTLEGVRRDTEHLIPLGVSGAIIAFHDYTARERRHLAVPWVKVPEYLDTLPYDFTHIAGTSVAFARLP